MSERTPGGTGRLASEVLWRGENITPARELMAKELEAEVMKLVGRFGDAHPEVLGVIVHLEFAFAPLQN